MKVNLAICSPNKNAYSETFIQAHRNIPNVNVKFYFNGYLPTMLDGVGNLHQSNLIGRVAGLIKRKIKTSPLTFEENALMQSFIKEKINCVYAEFGITGVSVMKICKQLNIPLVVHFHGFDATTLDVLESNKQKYPAMFKQAAAVIAVSKVMEQKLIQLGCPPQKLHYITYGPNDSFFEIKPLYNKKLFIAIGRFVDKKAPYYLILSFIEVLKLHPTAKLVIGGDGNLLNACKNLIRFYQLENNIELPGVLNPEKFRDYLISANAFVQHSITAENGDMEGTPVAVLEASAASLPVISTYHAGIPDVVINEKTGLLVAEHDVLGMAKNMCKILENDELAEQMGKAGRENIKQNYTMSIHLKKISDLISSVTS